MKLIVEQAYVALHDEIFEVAKYKDGAGSDTGGGSAVGARVMRIEHPVETCQEALQDRHEIATKSSMSGEATRQIAFKSFLARSEGDRNREGCPTVIYFVGLDNSLESDGSPKHSNTGRGSGILEDV